MKGRVQSGFPYPVDQIHNNFFLQEEMTGIKNRLQKTSGQKMFILFYDIFLIQVQDEFKQ